MNLGQMLFHLGELPVTTGRFATAVLILLVFIGGALWATAYFSRRLLWPGSAGGNTIRLLLSAFRVKIILLGVLTALAALGLNMLPIFGILLALGVIASLSWRTTSGQIWAGFLILWERPFALGERIQAGHYEGEVERVGLRTTTLRSEERMAIHVPNSYLTHHAIHNRSKTEGGFGLRIPVEVAVHCDSGEVITALRKAAERNNRVRSSPSPKAFMTGFSPRGLQFELRAWVDAYTDAMWAQNELCRAIQSEFQRAGIQLASSRIPVRPGEIPARPRVRPEAEREGGRDRDFGKDREAGRDRDAARERGEGGRERDAARERGEGGRDREAGREREGGRDRGRGREHSRPDRHGRGDRRPAGEGAQEGHGRDRARNFESPAAQTREVLPSMEMAPVVEEEAPQMEHYEAPVSATPDPGHFDISAPVTMPEEPAHVAYPEPEHMEAPVEASVEAPSAEGQDAGVPEESSPTYGRGKRRVPRR